MLTNVDLWIYIYAGEYVACVLTNAELRKTTLLATSVRGLSHKCRGLKLLVYAVLSY
jgi:hypothetical protein